MSSIVQGRRRAAISASPRKHRRKTPAPASNPQHDLCWGAASIAEALGVSERRAFWLLENELIPASKIGRTWCASRTRLLTHCSGGVS
jgi:hypothetical protein